jgi:hypothetical protein
VVANLDSVNKRLKESMAIFFGTTGVTHPTAQQLKIRLNQQLSKMCTTRVYRIGSQLVDGEVASVRRHPHVSGRLVIDANIVVPVPSQHGLPPGDAAIKRQVIG